MPSSVREYQGTFPHKGQNLLYLLYKKIFLIKTKKTTSVAPEGDVQFGHCIAQGLGGFSYYGGIITSKLNKLHCGT
uniref:Uncharacterized protein n=1 Tax=Anguilla anguilla TaxID=7936 RepID=A0A0E9PLU7_ANGAN